jgi:curved DNA-binding protein CbpA
MPPQKNYYEILGLPRDATVAQIKKRYRELARKYHPDVMADKALAQRMFVEIGEAYQTLTDPMSRRDYDRTLPAPDSIGTRFDSARVNGGESAGRSSAAASHSHGPAPNVAVLLKDAQFSFIRHRFNEAANLCKQALKIDRTNARAHAVLGDVYRAQGKTDRAINEYSFAVEYDPADRQSREKLDSLLEREHQFLRKTPRPPAAERRADEAERPVSRPRPPRHEHSPSDRGRLAIPEKQVVGVNLVTQGAVLAILMAVGRWPGAPAAAFRTYLPLVSAWSWNLVVALAAAAALSAAVMTMTGVTDHPDDELVFEDAGVIPTGLLLLLFCGFFFWGAAALYMVLGAIQGNLSRSVLKVFASVALIVLFAGFLYPIGGDQVWLLGGNVAFIGALIGWYGGSTIRPLTG